ncbi:hypothetical protein ACQR1I_16710 [Bradyrhizobium sp. HKCCYLS2038]|uniref:hypothetical protein n=1 Tax=unclassified Bradyrhizobium TaxID=2631580 RepID=UPI003EBD81F9
MQRKKPQQLMLDVRMYVMNCGPFGAVEVQAGTRSAAKYQVFKQAREAGYFDKPNGFREFLSRGWHLMELRH